MNLNKVYRFSVIVPIYNKEKYIVRCLESLMEQSLREMEIICVDDGSLDSSNIYVRDCMSKDNRIFLIENGTNRGVAYSRNVALNQAKGEYILFLDADDYLETEALEHYYEEISNSDAEMLFFNFIIKRESKRRLNCDEGIRGIYPKIYNGQELLESFAQNDEFFLYACMVVYKKEFVVQNNLHFIDLNCGEGGEFILSALFVAEKVIISSYRGYVYCLNDSSVNSSNDIVQEALYGQVVQYIHMLQRASQTPQPKPICTFLDWYKAKIMGAISNLSEESILKFDQRLENAYSRHIWSLLTNAGGYADEPLFNEEDMKLLGKEHAVIVYGAGRETLETLKLLNRLQIELLGIIVTQKKGNPDILYGYRIQDIESLSMFDSNSLVLITAHSKHQRTIAMELENRGYHRYINVNRR